MDFGALLHVAKKNSENTKTSEGKYYSTKFAPPRKESKEKKLSDNIKKFLAKKEQEEQERLRAEKEKREQLLSLRDDKSKNKIKKMLKVIKSANKSVLDDAVDTEHTAVTIQGPEQPDQDDYGYVSNEASAFYEKYIEKVKDVKEDKSFAPSRPASRTDLTGTKDRVKAALLRESLEKMQPHTRVRTAHPKAQPTVTGPITGSLRRKDLYDPDAEKNLEEQKRREEKSKFKKPLPPPMDFQSLLKLAEKKQFEPVAVVVETKKEPERLLTKKEKREHEERQRYFEEKERRKKELEKSGGKPAQVTKSVVEPQKMEPNGRIPKLSNSTTAPIKSMSSNMPSSHNSKSSDSKHQKPINPGPSPNAKHSSSTAKVSVPTHNGNTIRPVTNGVGLSKDKLSQKSASNLKPTTPSSSSTSNGKLQSQSNAPTREFPPKDLKPSSSVDRSKSAPAPQKTRQFPPPDVKRPNKPLDKKPQTLKRRIYDDDEDEYDSELDDFIDDGDENEDYSQHIKAIFGYDRSKYKDDDDDAAMESTFAQQMREEYVSKKIGLMEDLEDMRQEAEDKKRKAIKKRKLH